MSLSKQDNKMYLKIAELKFALDANLDEQCIEKILQKDFDVNYRVPSNLIGMSRVDNMTALHLAQHERRIDLSKLLLSYGADITMKNSLGSTALHATMERAYQHETFRLLSATYQFADLILSAHIHSRNFNNPINSNGISHFHAACTVNNVEAVRFFLDHEVPVNERIHVASSILPGYTALHIAVKLYSLETVDLLLQYNADVNLKNLDGLTPIHLCLKQKMTQIDNSCEFHTRELNEFYQWKLKMADKILLLLLQKYCLSDDVGLSHLHISSILTDSSVASYLLEQHGNIINQSLKENSPIYPGYTALHLAARCNIETIKLLVTKGADMESKDVKGSTPLDLCLQRYNIEEVHSILSCHPVWKDILLVDKKTKLLDLIGTFSNAEKFLLLKKKSSLDFKKQLLPSNSRLWPGYTMLHLNITMSNDRNETGSMNVTLQDSLGSTPLHLIVQKEKCIISKVFCSLQFHHDELEDLVNSDNLSHLHCIVARGYQNLKQIKKLLLQNQEKNIDSHLTYKGPTVYGLTNGSTPLHTALTRGNIDEKVVQMLVEYGADIYARDVQNLTPVHRILALKEYDRRVNGKILLLSSDLRDSIVENIGLSHLHVASCINNIKSVKKLLDQGVDINLQISTKLPTDLSFLAKYAGFTPLHIAVKKNSKDVVDFLLQHGADMFAKNVDGISLIYEILSSTNVVHLKSFVDTLQNNYVLQSRFYKETGLTMFHVACHNIDIDTMNYYFLNNAVNINVQAHVDSPIWPGFTALHILAERIRLFRENIRITDVSDEDQLIHDNLVDNVLKFLLSNGANVTIENSYCRTPLHLFFQNMRANKNGCKKDYSRVKSLMKAHKDFNCNPIDPEGTSHFHITCAINNSVAAQQFLKHGVDVNQSNHRGDTPLHMSVNSFVLNFSGSSAQFKTIEFLLKHGAQINVKNNLGNTPLHEAASNRLSVTAKVFERLLKAGADPKAENVFQSTPLELLCKSRLVSMRHLKLFIERGCHLNTFNPISKEGVIGLLFNTCNLNSKWDSIWKAVFKLIDAKEVNQIGRSVLHNVVSVKESLLIATNDCILDDLSDSELDWDSYSLKYKLNYKVMIEQLMNSGCDIDTRDETGQTALHKAAKFGNRVAVSVLIEVGADGNIVDKSGKTALAYAFEPYLRSKYSELNEREREINKMLLWQLIILQHFELDVCEINKTILSEAMTVRSFKGMESKLPEFYDPEEDSETEDDEFKSFRDEIIRAKDFKVTELWTLKSFLSEDIVFTYPYTSINNRSAIRDFVSSIDDSGFKELKPLIKLHFRKAENRIILVENATASLRKLSSFAVPDLCIRIIFDSLKNVDLENLIAAALKDNAN